MLPYSDLSKCFFWRQTFEVKWNSNWFCYLDRGITYLTSIKDVEGAYCSVKKAQIYNNIISFSVNELTSIRNFLQLSLE